MTGAIPLASPDPSYARLAMQLDADIGRDGRGRCLLLASAVDGALCAQPALELGLFISASQGRKVLLVDASPAHPELSRLVGCAQAPGFGELLARGPGEIGKLVRPTGQPRLSILPAGTAWSGPFSAVDQALVSACLDRMRTDFDDVLLGVPPVLEHAMPSWLPALADGVLLLAQQGRSRLEELDESQQVLAAGRAQRVGIVLTAAPKSRFWRLRRV